MPQTPELIKAFCSCLPNFCIHCGAWHDDGTLYLCMKCLDKEEHQPKVVFEKRSENNESETQ